MFHEEESTLHNIMQNVSESSESNSEKRIHQ